MRSLRFALRRTLRARSFLLLLVLCAAAILLAPLTGKTARLPAAGICDLCGSETSARVTALLEEQGFLPFSSPEEMDALVEQGELNCAVTLPAQLDLLIREGRLEGAIPFTVSPTSYAPELHRNLAAAALFREYAPYLTAEALSHTGITEEQALTRYRTMLEEGAAFTFSMTTAEGTPLTTDSSAEGPVMGAVAIGLMAALFSGISSLAEDPFPAIAGRLGASRAMTLLLLPGLAVRAALAAGAAILPLALLPSARQLIPAVPIYVALLCAAALLITALLPRRRQMFILLCLLVIASAALCPLFYDPALLSPLAGAVRPLLPSYWLWLIRDRPLPWLAAAPAALSLSVGLLLLRLNRSTERNFS